MSGRAQLFVGRLPMDIRERDVEQVFEKYGRLLRCDVKYGNETLGRYQQKESLVGMYGSRRGSRTGLAYAFVDYDDRRDAEDAIKYENGREMHGQSIVVEWARGPSYRPGGGSNFQRQSRSSGYQRQRSQTNDECYRCRRQGHWARDCPELERDRYYARRYRSRSRSRSRSHRRNRSRSREHRRRSPTPERHQKSRSGSRDQRGKQRSPSRSPSKSYSRSRSRSVSKDRKKNDIAVGKGKERSVSKSPSRSRTPSKSRSRSPSYGRKGSSSPRKSPGNDADYDGKRCENGRGDNLERRSFSGSPRKSASRSISRERDVDVASDRSRSHSR